MAFRGVVKGDASVQQRRRCCDAAGCQAANPLLVELLRLAVAG